MTNSIWKILTVVGARPQFVKAAVVSRYIRQSGEEKEIDEILVHTGQHYDEMMSDIFFKELKMKPPEYNLEVGSETTGRQLGAMLDGLEQVLQKEKPDAVLVYGDTNSTLAAAIIAAHHNIPLIHAEAGERIYRRRDVPEEINRILTDNIASLCLTSTIRASEYLKREGMAPERIRFVGDTMYELFSWAKENIDQLTSVTPGDLGLEPGKYHIATIHRAQNTASKEILFTILEALDNADLPVLLPVHPRVQKLIDEWNYTPKNNLKLTEPLGYFEFLKMLLDCNRVVTDSGGVTREAFFARKPCIVPMENSWWTEIVESGWAVTVGVDGQKIIDALATLIPPNIYPEGLFGDGKSSKHIVDEIKMFLKGYTGDGVWHTHGPFEVLPPPTSTDFTYHNYMNILEKLKGKGYQFGSFKDAEILLKGEKPFVMLRHDIDLSLKKALEIAELEAEHGVVSTFFFMTRSDFYNIFSKEGFDIVTRILGLGHHLGLHFDCAPYPVNHTVEDLARACANEINMLEHWFEKTVEIVSYHRPNKLVLTGNRQLSKPLPHTYMPIFTKEIHYYADSRGQWKYGNPLDSEAFKKGEPLHLLIHPVWWNTTPTSNYQTLLRFVDEEMEKIEKALAANCTVYRIGRLGEEYKK